MKEFRWIIRNGGLSFAENIHQLRSSYLISLKEGQQGIERLSLYRPRKTYEQVKLIMGYMIRETIVQANDLGIDCSDFLQYLIQKDIPKGVPLTMDFLHQLMYMMSPTTDEDGRKITLSQMDVIQAMELFERFRNMVAPCGIIIQDPDPNWKNKE
jgi:hypothetical protein